MENVITKNGINLLGDDLNVPVWGGGDRRYINLDNAATTPPFSAVWDLLGKVMPLYGSIHRGAGYKSAVSTQIYEDAVRQLYQFTDSNDHDDVLIFSYNTTACINHLERRLGLTENDLVIVGENEHSSNLLPWRKNARNITCRSLPEGVIDYGHLETLLRQHKPRLVAISGASNVTGVLTDIHLVARLAHCYGAEIFVDASQLVAHRRIVRKPKDDPEHIDYLAFSGHKMYAPFGLGVLVANKQQFEKGWPDVAGGGTISIIDDTDVIWSALPARESGGTPNFPGVVALAEASRQLQAFGYDQIKTHERLLTVAFQKNVAALPGINVFRGLNSMDHEHLAIFPFSVNGYHHSLIGAFLGVEKGIGVRTGHLCQFALVSKFLHIGTDDKAHIKEQLIVGDKKGMYGIVRASCGLGNSVEDIKKLGEALEALLAHGPKASYRQQNDGEYLADGWHPTISTIHS